MKKAVIFLIVLAISVSPLFRGLFFNLEISIFLALLALLTFFYFMLKLSGKEPVVFNKWLLLSGFLLLLSYALAFINAVYIRRNIDAILLIASYLMVSIVLYDYYHDKKEKLAFSLMLPVFISGFVNAVIGMEAITGAFRFLNNTVSFRRLGGTFQYCNTASIYFTICVIFSLTIMYTANKPVLRILFTGMNSILLLAMLLTRSRGGYIVGFAAILLLFAIQAKGFKYKTACSFVCAAMPALLLLRRASDLTASQDALSITMLMVISFIGAAMLALLFEGVLLTASRIRLKTSVSEVLNIAMPLAITAAVIVLAILNRQWIISLVPQNITERFSKLNMSDTNVFIRLVFDFDALKLISKYWLLGVGGGGWAVLYYTVQDFYYVSRAAHNHYLEVFVEAGILAFLTFSGTVLVAFISMLRNLFKAKETGLKIFMTGLACGFLALVLHSSFDFDLSFVSMGLLFWSMVTASAVQYAEEPQHSKKSLISTSKVWVSLVIILCCSALMSINGLYASAAYNANKALNSNISGDYSSSCAYYEEAHRLDPLNSDYTFELTRLYNYFANWSKEDEKTDYWRQKSIETARKGVELNPFLPDNIRLLVRNCLRDNLSLEALENAEKLVEYQPYYGDNYELLARAYIDAAEAYREMNNYERARELWLLCANMELPQGADMNKNIELYKEKAIKHLAEN